MENISNGGWIFYISKRVPHTPLNRVYLTAKIYLETDIKKIKFWGRIFLGTRAHKIRPWVMRDGIESIRLPAPSGCVAVFRVCSPPPTPIRIWTRDCTFGPSQDTLPLLIVLIYPQCTDLLGVVTNTGYNSMPTSLHSADANPLFRRGSVVTVDKPRASRSPSMLVADITDCATSPSRFLKLLFLHCSPLLGFARVANICSCPSFDSLCKQMNYLCATLWSLAWFLGIYLI